MFGHLSFPTTSPPWAALSISTAALYHSYLSVSQSPHQAVDHTKGRASCMLPALFPAPGTVPTKVAPYILIRWKNVHFLSLQFTLELCLPFLSKIIAYISWPQDICVWLKFNFSRLKAYYISPYVLCQTTHNSPKSPVLLLIFSPCLE